MKTDNVGKEEETLQKLIQKLKGNGFTGYGFNSGVYYKGRCIDLIVTKDGVRVMAFELKNHAPNHKLLREQFGPYNLEIPLYFAYLNSDNELTILEYRNGNFGVMSINEITPRAIASTIKEKVFEKYEKPPYLLKQCLNTERKVHRWGWYVAALVCLIYLIAAIFSMNSKCFFLPIDFHIIIWILLIVVLSLMPHILIGTNEGKNIIETLKYISKIFS